VGPVMAPARQRLAAAAGIDPDLGRWRGLLLIGGWAALGSVALTVVQIGVFAKWPAPGTVPEIFDLMLRSPLLGVVSMDGLYLVNNLMVLLVYLALAVLLWTASRSAVVLALTLGFLQMAAYYASNPAVEMLTLAHLYDRTGASGQAAIKGAGEALLARWTGTAFLVYYFLGAFVLLILAWLLKRTTTFPPSTAWWALAAGILMLVPSPFGLVGMIFAIASLVPWSVFCVLVGVTMLRLARH
jgi:hypothetical protein